jgi:hypothetical protein
MMVEGDTILELQAQRWDREANNWKSLFDLSDKEITRVIRATMHAKYGSAIRYAASCRREGA